MSSIDEIISRAVQGDLSHADAEAFCSVHGIQLSDFYNRAPLAIAERFDAGAMPYDEADEAMNQLWGMIMRGIAQGDGFTLPEPAFAIYEAFDAGEYDHGDGADPVEKYTKPLIAKLVISARKS